MCEGTIMSAPCRIIIMQIISISKCFEISPMKSLFELQIEYLFYLS